ncbi:type VI secretion system-associated protein TagF [Alteromonas sp. ASW11-130]|uniref:type VI secretion system-associated protein TagF n=1 Tax=Alteromonas sp. ASW11-130 TaxID=3015775 RepID=UPI002242284E|nr:type VI secretion system-associated protein TagF [Alteromonas sp. ASW11-130]MCW8090306.1 type VI secretion system-associated protein TagF [Alteromonas sp. ASW11-130]
MTGFFGKIPTKGDFVSRNLTSSASQKLLSFFTDGMKTARSKMDDSWTEHYSTAPIWYFYLSPGVIGEQAYLGAWMVSVDNVNRQFPFIALSKLATPPDTLADIGLYTEWLLQLEHFMLDLLEPDMDTDESLNAIHKFELSTNADPRLSIDSLLEGTGEQDSVQYSHFEQAVLKKLERLEQSVQTIELFITKVSDTENETKEKTATIDALSFDINLAEYSSQFSEFILPTHTQHSVWLTQGSNLVPESVVIYKALPPPENFFKFVGGAPHA